ncbi:UNVERIFIED_CONTAM: hypothetical protein GTU68_042562 [Idotea baltica]|nr:hypothetical protein [Idotea baltica]
MKHPKIPLAQTIIQLCKAKNIEHIVISPGSRNAPLTIGFTHDEYFKCYSIVDERCAGFFALGIAQQILKPVAVVCTSGSALLNYYPAISEAFYSNISLVVLSADRPKHLVDIGDGQTINQKNVFDNHILYSANLVQDTNVEHNDTKINEALNISIYKKGPVHINIPFDEPLYETIDSLSVNPKVIDLNLKQNKIDNLLLSQLVDEWSNASKKMVIVGVNSPNTIEQKWLDVLADDESVLVFTETTSNLHHAKFFPSIDKIIAPLSDDELKALQPDILLTFGGLIVSKKIKAFLRNHKPKHHWHIDEHKANDTFFSLDHFIKMSPNEFFTSFFKSVTQLTKTNYNELWTSVKQHRKKKHDLYMDEIPFSDLKVFDSVLRAIPMYSILQLSNSSTVRYAQLFNLNKTLNVFCNRGTSGIDGSMSTAIGCATYSEKQTVFITGDLSFFYDSNALWNNYIPNNFRIIIINNQGGGIFRILPGNKNSVNFDTFFETKHNLTAKHLSEMYGFIYRTASSEDELETELESFFQDAENPKILEIFTPRTVNDSVLRNYFKAIK